MFRVPLKSLFCQLMNLNPTTDRSLAMAGLRALSTSADGPKLQEMIRSIVPCLTSDKYKGQCGRLGIVGGCREYTGAPYFAAISAMKVGADLAHVFCTEDAATVIKSYSPELIVHPILDSNDAELQWAQWVGRMHAVVIGPGLGRNPNVLSNAKSFMKKVMELRLPLILDADGLWILLSDPGVIHGYSRAILTPNAVEFARLQEAVLGQQPRLEQRDVAADADEAEKLSKALGYVTIIRKGKEDIITDGHSSIICNSDGSHRRCGGQGDLLSGSLATFAHWSHMAHSKNSKLNDQLQECGPSLCAAYASCLLTRQCAVNAFKEFGRSTTTTDLISQIHKSFVCLFE